MWSKDCLLVKYSGHLSYNHITQFCLSGVLPKYRFRAAAEGLLKAIFRDKFLLESFAVLNGEFFMRERLL